MRGTGSKSPSSVDYCATPTGISFGPTTVSSDPSGTRSVRDAIQRDFKLSSLMIRPSINPGLNDEHLEDIRSFLGHLHKNTIFVGST